MIATSLLMGLMALAGQSTALSISSSLLDTFVPRNLVPRQNSTSTSKCPDGFTAQNGLKFTTYCGQNNPFNDALPAPFTSPSMEDCMEHCSRFMGAGEGCFGIAYNNQQLCWIKNSTSLTTNMSPLQDLNYAVPNKDQMAPQPTTCPQADRSTNSLDSTNGLVQYTTFCGKDMPGFDLGVCANGSPNSDPYRGCYHADTLEQCLQYCVDAHPLCMAVIWSPDLSIGYGNCYLKKSGSIPPVDPRAKLHVHSAALTTITTPDTKCPTNTKYGATGNKYYDIQCGKVNQGQNMTTVHAQNVTSCIDSCATTQGCVGINFDTGLSGGFRNCYLQNSTSVLIDEPGAMYASAGAAPSGTPGSTALPNGGSDNNSTTNKSSSSTSKAWIAGLVIGIIALFLLLGAAVFFVRRRRARRNNPAYGGHNELPGASTPPPAEKPPQQTYYGPAAATPAYSKWRHEAAAQGQELNEIGDSPSRGELPAVSEKYAHKAGDAKLGASTDGGVHRPGDERPTMHEMAG